MAFNKQLYEGLGDEQLWIAPSLTNSGLNLGSHEIANNATLQGDAYIGDLDGAGGTSAIRLSGNSGSYANLGSWKHFARRSVGSARFSGDFTISWWAQLHTQSSNKFHMAAYDTTDSAKQCFQIMDSAGGITGNISFSNQSFFLRSYPTNVPVGEWAHYAVTYEYDANVTNGFGRRIYINGGEQFDRTNSSFSNSTHNPGAEVDIILGSRHDGSSFNIHASFDDIRIFSRLLTEDEIGHLSRSRCNLGRPDREPHKVYIGSGIGDERIWLCPSLTKSRKNIGSTGSVNDSVPAVHTTGGGYYKGSHLANNDGLAFYSDGLNECWETAGDFSLALPSGETPDKGMSISFWVNTETDVSGINPILSFGDTISTTNFYAYPDGSQYPSYLKFTHQTDRYNHSTGSYETLGFSNKTASIDANGFNGGHALSQWKHYVILFYPNYDSGYNSGTPTQRENYVIFEDGVPKENPSDPLGGIISEQETPLQGGTLSETFTINGLLAGSNSYLSNHYVDDIRIFERALTYDECVHLSKGRGTLGTPVRQMHKVIPEQEGIGGEVLWYCPSAADGKAGYYDLSKHPFVYDWTVKSDPNRIDGHTYGVEIVDDTYASGKKAYSLENANSDYVSADRPASEVHSATEFSYAGWIKTSNSSQDSPLVGAYAIHQDRGASLGIESTGEARFLYQSSGSTYDSNQEVSSSVTTLTDGEWHHLACTFDGVNGKAQIFIDGVLDTEKTSNVPASVNQTYDFRIGNRSANSMEGLCDDIRVYDRVITENEVRHLAKERGIQGRPSRRVRGMGGEVLWICPTLGEGDDLSGNEVAPVSTVGSPEVVQELGEGGIRALEFFGSDYIEYPSLGDLVGDGDFSMAFWVYYDNNSPTLEYAVSSYDSSGDQAFRFGNSAGALDWNLQQHLGSAVHTGFRMYYSTLNSGWNHIGISYNSDSEKCWYFQNGEFQGEGDYLPSWSGNPLDGNAGSFGRTAAVTIGGSKASPSNGLSGKMDDIRLFDRELDEREMRHLASRRAAAGPAPETRQFKGLGGEIAWFCPTLEISKRDLAGRGAEVVFHPEDHAILKAQHRDLNFTYNTGHDGGAPCRIKFTDLDDPGWMDAVGNGANKYDFGSFSILRYGGRSGFAAHINRGDGIAMSLPPLSGNSMTVSLWHYQNGSTGRTYCNMFQLSATDEYNNGFIETQDYLVRFMNRGGSYPVFYGSDSNPLTFVNPAGLGLRESDSYLGYWHHHTWVIDANTIDVYIDAVHASTITSPSSEDILKHTRRYAQIGGTIYDAVDGDTYPDMYRSIYSQKSFINVYDDVRVFDRALTQSEIDKVASSRGYQSETMPELGAPNTTVGNNHSIRNVDHPIKF